MDTVTFYLRRSWLARAFGGSPLVRTNDRVEALVLILAFTVVVVVTPIAGAIGTAVHETRAHRYSEEARSHHAVVATVTDSPASNMQSDRVVITAPAKWRVGDIERRGEVEVGSATEVGDRLQLWVDEDGEQVRQPPAKWRAGADALAVATGFWLSVVASVAGLTVWLRTRLARQRDAAWERAWKSMIDDGGGRTGSQA